MMPSINALMRSINALNRHCKRSCWVYRGQPQIISTLHLYGWKQPSPQTLEIDWDSISQVRQRVFLIQKGCTCKTGGKTARCKCKKKEQYCGPGCKCQDCALLSSSTCPLENSSTSESDTNLEEEVDDIIEQVFCDFSLTHIQEPDSPNL